MDEVEIKRKDENEGIIFVPNSIEKDSLNRFNKGFLLGFMSGLVCYTIVYLILTFTI